MPPKKKIKRVRRNKTKPLQKQKQTQKQVVNIKIGDDVKRRRRVRSKRSVVPSTNQLASSVQSLGSNLNMFSSDTQRLNNLENLIVSLLNKDKAPARVQTINPAQTPIQEQEGQRLGTGTPSETPRVEVPSVGRAGGTEPQSALSVFPTTTPEASMLRTPVPATLVPELDQMIQEQREFIETRLKREPDPFAGTFGRGDDMSSRSSITEGAYGGGMSVEDDDMSSIGGGSMMISPVQTPLVFNPPLDIEDITYAENPFIEGQAEEPAVPLVPSGRKTRVDKGVPRGMNIVGQRNLLADEFAERQRKKRGLKTLSTLLNERRL